MLEEISNDIDNKKDCLARYWKAIVDERKDIHELCRVYENIWYNLPEAPYYIMEDMLTDRERYSIIKCPNYIVGMLEEFDVETIDQLPEAKQKEIWEILKSGYGSCVCDW